MDKKIAPKLVFNHEATLFPLKCRLKKLPSPQVSLGGDEINSAPWKSNSQGLEVFGKTDCPGLPLMGPSQSLSHPARHSGLMKFYEKGR